jgi:hypothetical protein
MNIKKTSLVLILAGAISACTTKPKETVTQPVALFDSNESEPAAVQLADSVVSAHGGQKAWDDARFITWSVSGDRDLSWDKQTGKVRIHSKADKTIYLLNTNTGEGKVQQDGKEITDAEILSGKVAQGIQLWKSDSYSLFLPFKLKEAGVSLTYLGEDTLSGGKVNIVLLRVRNEAHQMQRKYQVFIGQKDNLIKEISDYNPSTPDSLGDKIRVDNYQPYGKILLSADRADGKGPRNVKVVESLSDNIFDQF